MMVDVMVMASIAAAGAFLAMWLVRPALRARIEEPKHEFQAAVQRFDRATRARRGSRA